MSRDLMPVKKDVKLFRRTAMQTKRVNLGISMMRGGIRF